MFEQYYSGGYNAVSVTQQAVFFLDRDMKKHFFHWQLAQIRELYNAPPKSLSGQRDNYLDIITC